MTTKREIVWAEAFKAHLNDESKPEPGPAPTMEIWEQAVIQGLRDIRNANSHTE